VGRPPTSYFFLRLSRVGFLAPVVLNLPAAVAERAFVRPLICVAVVRARADGLLPCVLASAGFLGASLGALLLCVADEAAALAAFPYRKS